MANYLRDKDMNSKLQIQKFHNDIHLDICQLQNINGPIAFNERFMQNPITLIILISGFVGTIPKKKQKAF